MNILKFKKKPHIIVCNREGKHDSGWISFSFTYNYFKSLFFFNNLFWKSSVFSIKSIIKFMTSPLSFSLQRGKWFCCCRHICRIKFTKSQWVLTLDKIVFCLVQGVKYLDVLLSHILLKVPIVKFWSLVGTDDLGSSRATQYVLECLDDRFSFSVFQGSNPHETREHVYDH